MKNLKIGVRLAIAFACMVVIISVMAMFSYIKLGGMRHQVDTLTNVSFAKAQASFATSTAIQNVIRSVFLIIAVEDKDFRVKQQQYIDSERAKYKESLKQLEALEKTEKGKALIEKVKTAVKALVAADNKALKLALELRSKEAGEVLSKESEPLVMPLLNAVSEMAAYYKEGTDASYQQAQAGYKSAIIWLVSLSIISILFAVVCAILITRSITNPLDNMLEIIKVISRGDLTKRLTITSRDELGETCGLFNDFVNKFQGIINQIAQTTNHVADSSKHLFSTAEQMATGAQQVTAQAETVATAGEEMSATSGNIASNCAMAAEGSRQAGTAAMSGARVVDETIAEMNSIAERVRSTAQAVESLGSRSEQIGEIVGTIEDIADQTNLLALNAAIEAARAGEQGRGFAVVADEVRALAERTTNATKEIGEMIKTIQQETKAAVSAMEIGVGEVARGSEKAADSGKALEQILEQVNNVTTQINQVATAAEEQTATTSEISNNMHQITAVVAQTSHGARESAAAANELSKLAEDLRQVVGQFRLA